MRLILGSGSPRRRELLSQIGIVPDAILPPEIDEDPRAGELPRVYCHRIVTEKLAAIPAAAGDLVLCADTTVAVGRRILGKPADAAEARAFLRLLSGRRHRAFTAVALGRDGVTRDRVVQSQIRMKRLSEAEIDAYIDSGEWQGKAGGYAIQGRAAAFVAWIEGSFTGIVGLPLAETSALLASFGYPVTGGSA
ncbi:Maf family protein [Mangrovicoccus algicola]|uniref:dTTP/UTP pyrophosphatase n=1 Tax=Mangrovicoccus algicola TaxID=2771008 RepID=A0A8J7CFZ0_9RHOB|nr:Maf family protein [Mangrovicoccus algicola]MBE3636705.1 septum formation protein Maf [Mangrovicoccus algicola]